MTIQDKIKVMQHFADGGKIEFRRLNSPEWGLWGLTEDPMWDWSNYNYRIKQEQPKTKEVFEWYYRFFNSTVPCTSNKLMTEREAREYFTKNTFYEKTGRSFIVEDK